MANLKNAMPASLRKPVETGRFSQGLMPKPAKKDVGGSAGSALKNRFAKLPQEPEDARLTGMTRSLNRRLLGLNLRGCGLRAGLA